MLDIYPLKMEKSRKEEREKDAGLLDLIDESDWKSMKNKNAENVGFTQSTFLEEITSPLLQVNWYKVQDHFILSDSPRK